jgi:crotonobetainyl-CoA:carnitine CoA-transferase CaiB-like acyl-CoA transferase
VGAQAGGLREQPQALEGLTVVELPCLDTMPFLAAAMAAKSFADFGAEVIKVEPPRVGAQERKLGPFRDGKRDPETGGLHLFLNTNKLGVTLDITRPQGRELLLRLLDRADVVFNPNLPPLNDRIGLGWRELVARFPKLIVVSVTFFGADSAYRELRGGDLIATHMSGVGYDTPYNQVTDLAKHPPLKLGGRQSDYLTGYAAASGAMCAYFARKKTGAGQHVDVNQWLAMVSMMRPSLGVYSHEGKEAPGFKRLSIRQKAGPQWVFPCKDGWVSLSVATDRFWNGAKRAMGKPEWMEQEIFQTLPGRAAHVDAIEAAATDWLSTRTRREAFERFQAEHVPCFPVHTPAEVAADEHMEARGFFVDHEHPAAGAVRMPGAPCRMSRTPWRIKRGAPRLGEHNRAIFGERLGLADKELAALAEERIV